jgi:O-antigen/teichoic acid export membrane protein
MHLRICNRKKQIPLNKYISIIKESFIVLVVEYLMLGAQVFASYVINHNYGVAAVGEFALVLAIAQIVIVGISLPFSSLIRRDLSLAGEEEARVYVTNVNYFRCANIIFAILLTLLIMPFFSGNMGGMKVFLLLMLVSKGFDMINDTYFVTYQSLSKYKLYAALKIIYASLMWGSLLLLFIYKWPIEVFYYSQAVIGLVYMLFNVYLFSKKRIGQKPKIEYKEKIKKTRFRLLHEAWPMIVNSLVSQASAKLNAIIIFHFIGAGDLGVFSVLLMFSNIFAGIGNSIGIVVISKFTVLAEESMAIFNRFFKKSLLLFLGIGLLMSIAYAIMLPILIHFYHFNPKGLLWLNISIGTAIPFLFTTSCVSNIFLILKKQVAGMYVSFLVLFVNVITYLGLSSSFGLQGAGYAYLIMAVLQLSFILLSAFSIMRKKSGLAVVAF